MQASVGTSTQNGLSGEHAGVMAKMVTGVSLPQYNIYVSHTHTHHSCHRCASSAPPCQCVAVCTGTRTYTLLGNVRPSMLRIQIKLDAIAEQASLL